MSIKSLWNDLSKVGFFCRVRSFRYARLSLILHHSRTLSRPGYRLSVSQKMPLRRPQARHLHKLPIRRPLLHLQKLPLLSGTILRRFVFQVCRVAIYATHVFS